MEGRLEGKVAVVTAAGQGIGRAIAEAFLREGARVWATDVDPAKLDGLDGAERDTLDVLSNEAVEAFARKVGRIHIHGTVLDCDERTWDFSFDLNVKSMHRTIKALLPGMLELGMGSIINIASGASSVKAAPNRYVYGATKAAVIGLTKAVALDFIKEGVRANAICPGTIQSPSLDERIGALAGSLGKAEEDARARFVARHPMGRLGTAEEIAHVAVYLAADESAFTTGTAVIVDGGWSL